ncbi:translation initiation factor IF-2 subunit beta [Halococcoides cellulosivorans]|uniref:Translation initiation factor IF-2 subunit beta n=1 Tax=Halococcoides cellulosivorans TaxID=1679096 RepID=A0A2R4X2A6_9EURY|nr:translation initiation factor IF-2 subunit beta [Halococcoides cellulosivorans]AWB27927.1 translation initiation factor IF-2 subunit beta [Halococcoides cellulosivorans]
MDYDEMLDRGMDETPEIGDRSGRFEVPDPTLRQEGNVTVFENYQSVIDDIDRDEEHAMKSLQNELGTSGHIDESGRARLTGEFSQRRMADALDAYVEEFVICPECNLPDTHLEREQGALLLQCEACGARSSTNS